MTSLRETDFVQDYCLSQRPLNGKTMHNKEVKYTAEPNDSCYDMGIPDRPGGRPSTCTESYCGQHTFPCLTLANATDTHTLEGAPDHQAYALKLRIMSSWVCEPKLVGFLAWGDRNTDARLCTCLCKHTHKKQNGELYKLKITHKPRYFCLISSVLFLSLGLSDG